MTDHVLKNLLDHLWNKGHTPRLIIDATHKDVLIPEWLRAQHKNHLVLDLDAKYPLNITFDVVSLAADFAFSGTTTRCTIPWDRVMVVVDRDTGEGFKAVPVVPANDTEPSTTPEPPKKKFSVIKGGKA